MSFALLIIGITMIVAAVRDTQGQLVSLLFKDFSGPGNFLYWIAALFLIGSIGYIDRLKPLSDALLLAIILGLILSKGNPKLPTGGFFKQLTDALGTTTRAGPQSQSGLQVSVF